MTDRDETFAKVAELIEPFNKKDIELKEEEYLDQIIERLHDDEQIYRTMARDIFQNGVVLERKKYRLLGYAYRIFLAGLTLSFGSFLIQFLVWYT